MWTFIMHHSTLSILAGYYLFSAFVSGMPDPDSTSGKGYMWAFKSLHLLSGDLAAGLASKLPQVPASIQTAQNAAKQTVAALDDAKASIAESNKQGG